MILTNLVGVYPLNIQTKFEANLCSNLREEVEIVKKFTRRRTQGDRYSHNYSLSATNKCLTEALLLFMID